MFCNSGSLQNNRTLTNVLAQARTGDIILIRDRVSFLLIQLGFGYKMRDANDYRGVVAEAKQTSYPHEVPEGFRLDGEKYTSSYVRRGISMEYKDPPKT